MLLIHLKSSINQHQKCFKLCQSIQQTIPRDCVLFAKAAVHMVDQLKPEHFLFYTLEKIKSFRLYEPNFLSTSIKPAYLLEKMQPTSPEHFPLKVEKELPKNPTRKQKQPISVPFIWETKPGIPKNDWNPVKPSRLPPPPPCQHPTNPVASNPFEWEEKPKILFPSFPIPTKESGRKDETISGETSGFVDEMEMLLETDFEAFNFETNNCLNLVPFEMEHGLVLLPHQPPINTLSPVSSCEEKTEKPHSYNPFVSKEFETDYPLENTILVGNERKNRDENEKIFESKFETFCFEINECFDQLEPQPSPPHPPIKLIASIPFKWEEKPGKPLSSFVYSKYNKDHESDYGNENTSEDEKETIPESDSEMYSFHTDESFRSVPSLLANRLVQSIDIANAIPVLETPVSPPGYESDSSTCSYTTGTTSLVGKPLLDRLFPLLSPKKGFLEKVMEKEKISEVSKTNLERKVSVWERGLSVAMRRPTTLEELIMMSRRRSYIRKAVPIKRNTSMGSMEKRESGGCFMFGISDKFEELQRKMKRQLQLKLI